MKKITFCITPLVVLFFCQSFVFMNSPTVNMEVKNSTIVWKGYKVSGSHEGTLPLQSGFFDI